MSSSPLLRLATALLPLVLAAQTCRADLLSRTIPGKWTEQFLPENEKEPYYPEYVAKDPLAKAQIQINVGQYRRALVTLAQADATKSTAEVALLKGEALEDLGRYDDALQVLDSADERTQILRADVLSRLERYPQAISLLKDVLQNDAASIPAHFHLGWYQEKSGDFNAALSAYRWFAQAPQSFLDKWRGNPRSFDNAADVVCIGRALDRWATLSGAYTRDQSLHNAILSMFTAAYQRIDTEFYAAHTAAAQYFLSHDDTNQAVDELSGAMGGNPHDLAAHALAGKIAVDSFNFAGTEEQISLIRDVDPDSTAADLLEARDLLQQRRPADALPALHRVLARFPQDVEALGLLAGAQALLLHDADMKRTLALADQLQPHSPAAYFEVAEQLSAMRQYPRAQAMYEIALQRAPWSADVRNGLGLLMTQSGDEDKARVILEAAHAVDPFNVRTLNYLKLLDMMDGFARKESAHFIVIYDPKQDPVIPEYFSDYLESVYPQVCGDFHFEPKRKTLIEVFPTHDAFSVRTTGAPWIATVGASTGRVIALAAPRDGAGGPFNWSRVVRHEFTHTVTLGATDNRIQHWFTEGLAVWEEHSPMPWEWIPMLDDAVTHHKLFALENLTWAFIRPRTPIDRQLGYAESYWICTYIEQQYGHAAILRLLDRCAAGDSINDMFLASLHESSAAFFDEFQIWAAKQVSTWGYDAASSAKYELLVSAGNLFLEKQDYAGAAMVWEKVQRLRPMDLLPHQRLMGIYLQLEDWPKAEEQLELLSQVEISNNRYVKVLSRLYARTGNLDLARQRALKAVYMNPYDMSAHKLLANMDEKCGDTADLAREQRVMPILADWLSQARDNSDNDRAPAPTAQ